MKLGIAGDPESIFSMMIGTSLLVTSSKENLLRFWHLTQDDNYALRLSDLDHFTQGASLSGDKIVSIGYSKKSKLLIGGTKGGNLVFFKNISNIDSPYEEEQWKPMPILNIKGRVLNVSIGNGTGAIAVTTTTKVSIISEIKIQGRMSEHIQLL